MSRPLRRSRPRRGRPDHPARGAVAGSGGRRPLPRHLPRRRGPRALPVRCPPRRHPAARPRPDHRGDGRGARGGSRRGPDDVGRPVALLGAARADPAARRGRRAVGRDAGRAGVRRCRGPGRQRADRAAGGAVGRADPDPGPVDGDARAGVAGCVRRDRRDAGAAPGDHPHPRADGRARPFYGADCPVVVVHRATQPGEVVLRGTVGGIADQVEAAGPSPGRGDPGRSGAGRGAHAGESWLYSTGRQR